MLLRSGVQYNFTVNVRSKKRKPKYAAAEEQPPSRWQKLNTSACLDGWKPSVASLPSSSSHFTSSILLSLHPHFPITLPASVLSLPTLPLLGMDPVPFARSGSVSSNDTFPAYISQDTVYLVNDQAGNGQQQRHVRFDN